MKKLLASLFISVLVLTGCGSSGHGNFKLPLSPVPLVMNVDTSIVSHLSVSVASGSYAKQATKDGAISQSIIYYIPSTGAKVIFMSVYEFSAATFDRLKNPSQPPAYGQEVLRKNGYVFSVAGPQDSIFDPKTADGINVSALYATIYKSATYSAQ